MPNIFNIVIYKLFYCILTSNIFDSNLIIFYTTPTWEIARYCSKGIFPRRRSLTHTVAAIATSLMKPATRQE